MSAIAPARQATRPQQRTQPSRPPRPALQVVAAPHAARRTAAGAGPVPLAFALVVAAVLGAGLLALLMLHTLAAQDAFTVHKLQRQAATLADVEQQLMITNEQAQAPSALAARAKALGMVPTGSLHIVRRHDGRIVAVATALPPPAPAATASPSPSASASPSVSPSAGPAGSKPSASTPAKAKPKAKPRRPH